jgi:signal transduction histidine kinase
MLKIILLLVVAVVNVLVGLAVLQRAPKKLSNISFAGIMWSMAGWAAGIAAFLLSNDYGISYFWAKFYYFFPILIGASIIIYTLTFPNNKKVEKKWLILTLGGAALLLIPLVFFEKFLTTSLTYHPWGKEIALNNTHYTLYAAYLFMTFGLSMVRMFLVSRRERGLEGAQAKLFFYGFLVASSFGVYYNLILPWVGNYRIIWAGPLFTSAFALSIAYSIIRHKMFDIRAVLARSITYLFALTFGVAVYAVLLFGAGAIFVQLDTIAIKQWFVIGSLALILAITYEPAVKIFNRLTNKIFFRDAYDPQRVLDKVSTIIVGNVDPHRLQKGALGALSEALRPTHMAFIFNNGEKLSGGDLVGNNWSMHNPALLQATFKRLGKKIIVYDELEEKNAKLKSTLRTEDISVLAPLVTKDEIIGYLVLGAKKSGSIYNSQDIGLLNIATNELAVALQNAQRFEEIQAFNITLQRKITDATRELKSTNRKLIALDDAKDEFISMASHQLRTPLTSIKGYLSMIVEGDLGKVNAAQEKALKEAFGSSQRMVYLIADFLNVSRIKTGKFVIESKEVNLPEIVREELTQLREMASSRELTLEYEQPEIFPRVKLDENKIRQVMMNMVDNAIYYTPTGGKITIQLYSMGDEIIFKVKDTGIGVPKREQYKLFTKFYRAGNAKKARPDGTGLGLFMAQKIVVEQGGAIIFESVEGKGSTFGFRFPLKKIQA